MGTFLGLEALVCPRLIALMLQMAMCKMEVELTEGHDPNLVDLQKSE
jgi:hypothetical protein